MSIELLIALIGLVTAIVGLLAALTPYLGSLSESVQIIERIVDRPDRSSSAQSWFVNAGENRGHLEWEDCVRYGCISAGGGPQYARALQRLKVGDTVYAYVTGAGYVGTGEVSSLAVPIDKFITRPDNVPLLKRDLSTSEINDQPSNLDFTDWVTGIKWLKTFDREKASRDTEHYIMTACEIQDSKRLASLRKTFGT